MMTGPTLPTFAPNSPNLRMRLDQLAEQSRRTALCRAAQPRAGSERLRARLADVEAKMVHVDRAPLMADLVTACDVREGMGSGRALTGNGQL